MLGKNVDSSGEFEAKLFPASGPKSRFFNNDPLATQSRAFC